MHTHAQPSTMTLIIYERINQSISSINSRYTAIITRKRTQIKFFFGQRQQKS